MLPDAVSEQNDIRPKRVAVVEDSALLAEAVSELLVALGYQVVGVLATAKQATQALVEDPTDIGLIDLHLPDGSGLDVATTLLNASDHARVVLFSDHRHLDDVERLPIRHRARISYLLKSSMGSREEFAEAFRVAHEYTTLDPGLSTASGPDPLARLSERQMEILGLMADGHSNRSIAKVLGLSPKTIEFYIAQIYSVLGSSGDDKRHPRVSAVQSLWARRRL